MRIKAIILKRQASNENDQLVTCYSEDHGTLRAMARSIYRPTSLQSMHLDALNLVEFELVHGKALPIITSAQVLHQFPNIKGSLGRLAAAHFFTEVLDKVSFENERDPKLWEFMQDLLATLENAEEHAVLQEFRDHQSRFLDVLGYAPQTSRCVVCSMAVDGPEKMIALSPELGGVMCADCFLASGRGILFDKGDLASLAGDNVVPIARHSAIDSFFEYTVGKKLASLTFLYSVLE
jgi:DNA repair protein RecO (recombination protein O)